MPSSRGCHSRAHYPLPLRILALIWLHIRIRTHKLTRTRALVHSKTATRYHRELRAQTCATKAQTAQSDGTVISRERTSRTAAIGSSGASPGAASGASPGAGQSPDAKSDGVKSFSDGDRSLSLGRPSLGPRRRKSPPTPTAGVAPPDTSGVLPLESVFVLFVQTAATAGSSVEAVRESTRPSVPRSRGCHSRGHYPLPLRILALIWLHQSTSGSDHLIHAYQISGNDRMHCTYSMIC